MARPRGAKARAEVVRERLALEYPEAICALVHDNAFQLLTATILSAQTTDENVNKVTPALFARYPTPADLAHANPDDVERLVFQTGFFRSKTKNLLGMARMLEEDFDGEVPTELDDLVKLPGVGRKTGNVVRSVAFDLPGLPVDTHVGRLSRRLKLTTEDDPVKVEVDLNALVPPDERGRFSLRMILHGRQVCYAAQARLWAVRAARHLPVRRSRREGSAEDGASGGERGGLGEKAAGAVERPVGAEEGTLGLVELGGDGAVVGVAVAVTDGDDPCGEVVELCFQARQLGEVGRRGHDPSLR